jgi:hypothetical protein
LVNEGEQVTAQDAANVLNAVHQKGGTSWTIESMVADLPKGLVYLYYFHQFDRPVLLSVKEEIASQRSPGPLSKLFPDDVQQEAARRYQRIQARAKHCQWVGMAWSAVVLAGLILLLSLCIGRRRGLRLWVPAAVLLGPAALLVWLVVGRCRQPGTWRIALLEAVGDVMPTVIAFVATGIIIILVPAVQGAWPLQIALEFGLPLAMGWLVFQGPLLASATERSYGRFLSQRLPQALVAANLGMGGMLMVALPLVNLSLRICTVLPLTVWPVMIWWAIAVLGALVGGLFLFLYECWAVRGGSQAWSVLAWGEAEVRTPSWRKLWWWILLSYGALLGGLAAGVILLLLLAA